ncbi:hypothetical protein ACFSSC_05315 [Corynebacterium mendelii]|uniref:Uncharacterized protein n=1 Tax=Corynebacterium mendelii TaxID=2765362 RepID=A0A939E0A4_9CORY|nr:hypothetical protein [Corynebacterium mendelii]MBN9643182.1 hypothetical protein [Corynebacterium mendelii]
MDREVSTDINVLITPGEWAAVAKDLVSRLEQRGIHGATVDAEEISLSCEPDNMLVTQYEQQQGHSPVAEVLHRVVINGRSTLTPRQLTAAVVACLPEDIYWYGTSHEGRTEPGGRAACDWNPDR